MSPRTKLMPYDQHFQITFIDAQDTKNRREMWCLGVPRVGDCVFIDAIGGKVTAVVWRGSGLPNLRSVEVHVG